MAWHDPVSNNWYSWDGVIPTGGLVVAPGSTPTPLGAGGWIDRTDVMLRSDLASEAVQD